MLSVSSLIEFLMNLLRDQATQAEFAQDPHGVLARHGLTDLSAQDVRDAAPMLADHETVQVNEDPVSRPHHHDPVQEITHLTQHYQITTTTVDDSDDYHLSYLDDRDTIITVDDRDTTTITADGDLTIEDSFNQDNDVNVIEDSFNQDNDGIDNKGGTIDHSVAAGEDIEDSLHSDNDITLDASDDAITLDTSTQDTTQTSADESFNQDNDNADLDAEEEAVDADTAA